MHAYVTKIRTFAALALLVLAAGLVSMPASAAPGATAAWVAHRALRHKILKEAGDRYGVQFLATHVDRLPGGERTVTGTGLFRRHRKETQHFTYHSTVNLRDNSDRDTGYNIQ